MAGADRIVSIDEFRNDPKLQAEFGGDYAKYVNSFSAKLAKWGLFNFANQGGTSVPGLNQVSLFYNVDRTSENKQAKEREEKVDKRLEQIKDPKIRAQILSEYSEGNLSEAFIDLLIARHEKKMAEFEEIWAKYQLAKGQAADLKKTCEKLLVEYQNSNGSSVRKGQYNDKYREYSEANMDADIYLSIARDVSHRIT